MTPTTNPFRAGRQACLCFGPALALALLPAAPVLAQQAPGGFRMPNQQQQLAQQPPAQIQGASNQPTVYPMGNFNYNPGMGGGYGGYGGFGGYYPGRVGGALQGVAAVTSANANYQGTIQNARVQQSYANQAGLDYRRKALDEIMYERSLRPSPEDIAAADSAQALRRARENPTQTEIWSGTTLNSLLNSIKMMQLGGLRGPMVPLDPEVARHINLTDGTTGGSVGLFRDGGQLQWPLVLKPKDFAEERKQIDKLAPLTVQQARSGQVSDDTLTSLIAAVDSLRNKVDAAVQTIPSNDWVKASRYVNELKSTIKALQDPNVAKQFNGQWSVRGNTVNELMDQLLAKGLKFAPAAPGDQPYYTSLYNSMLSYDMGLSQLAYRGQGGSMGQR